MKKILLSVLLLVSISYFNSSRAQCSGANITNFTAFFTTTSATYNFTWQHTNGNASIEVALLCNGTLVSSRPCIPSLKDSAAGTHNVNGVFSHTCSGTIRVEVRVWTNNFCGGTNCVGAFREVSLGSLPVDFKSFSATRTHSNVLLKWETISEYNCRGFAVERNIDGTWKEIAFLASLAQGGYSSDVISYQYIDANDSKGISQYRLRQVDFDNKSKYSETRIVRGDGQIGKVLVFPNPTNNGKVSVSFEDASVMRDVTLVDMSGRVLQQWKSLINNNSITIDNLTPGMYTLKVVLPETGEQTIEKIVVNKR